MKSTVLENHFRSVNYTLDARICKTGRTGRKGRSLKKKKTLWPLFMDGVQLPQG